MRKWIYLLLDILLILGALLNVAMIDGGKWTRTVVAFYEPVQLADLNRRTQVGSLDAGDRSSPQSGDRNGLDCLIIPAPGIAEMVDANVLLIVSNDCGDVPKTTGN